MPEIWKKCGGAVVIIVVLALFCTGFAGTATGAEPAYFFRKNNVPSADAGKEKAALEKIDAYIKILEQKSVRHSSPKYRKTENRADIGRIQYEINDAEYFSAILACVSLMNETDFFAASWQWDQIGNDAHHERLNRIVRIFVEKSFRTSESGIVDIREQLIDYFNRQLLWMAGKVNALPKGSDERSKQMQVYISCLSLYKTIIDTWSNDKNVVLSNSSKKTFLTAVDAFHNIHKIYGKSGSVDPDAVEGLIKNIKELQGTIHNMAEQTTADAYKADVMSDVLKGQIKDANDALYAINENVQGAPSLDEVVQASGKNAMEANAAPNSARAQSPEWLDKAIGLMKKHEYDQSINFLNKVVQSSPGDKDAPYYLGLSYYFKEDYKKAIPHFKQASGRYFKKYYYIGDCHYELGNYKEAFEWLMRYEINPRLEQYVAEHHPLMLAKANYRLGHIFYKMKKYKRTIEYAEKGMGFDRNYIMNHFIAGHAYYNMKEYKKAYAAFLETYELNPSKSNKKNVEMARSKLN